jgi:hypothetical protein
MSCLLALEKALLGDCLASSSSILLSVCSTCSHIHLGPTEVRSWDLVRSPASHPYPVSSNISQRHAQLFSMGLSPRECLYLLIVIQTPALTHRPSFILILKFLSSL